MELTDADLALFHERMVARFTPEELAQHGIDFWRVQPTQYWRTQLAEVDLEFFLRFYLHEHFSCAPAEFHRETYRQIEQDIADGEAHHELFIWPRGHGKTTTCLPGIVLWAICFAKRFCIPVIGDSHEQATMHLGTLKTEIEQNERIAEDFGNLQGAKWQEDNILTTKGTVIFALGKGMKLRGRKHGTIRPDLVLIDDPEELEAAMSTTQSTATENWLLRTVIPAGWHNTCVFVIGNIIHSNCLVNKLRENPSFRGKVYRAIESFAERDDLWAEWERLYKDFSVDSDIRLARARQFYLTNEQEMLRGAKVAWPQGHSYYSLMEKRATMGRSAFAVEYQNDPEDPGMRFFKSWKTYRQELRAVEPTTSNPQGVEVMLVPSDGAPAVPLSLCTLVAATDPSMGEKVGADPSAINILARSPTGQKFLLHVDKQRRLPDRIIEDQKEWFKRYPQILRWVIEKNQFQAFYATESRKRALEAGQDIPFVPRDTVANKILRIQSLQPAIENGEILFCETGQDSIIQELKRWQPFKEGQADDALDALEMANKELDMWAYSMQGTEITTGDLHEFNASIHETRDFDEEYDELEADIPERVQRERARKGLPPACVPRMFMHRSEW